MTALVALPLPSDPFMSAPLSYHPFAFSDKGLFTLAHTSPPPVPHVEYDASCYVAIDCEFVGVGQGGLLSALARVSICDYHGHCVLDTYCAPGQTVTDYRSWVSGVREADLADAPSFETVQGMVRDIIRGKVLVGHAVHNDLEVLNLVHPAIHTRDTAFYEPLQQMAGTTRPSLRALAKLVLAVDVQRGEHSSVEDARTTMSIFRHYQQAWEASLEMPAPVLRRHHSGSSNRQYSPHAQRTPNRSISGGTPVPRVNLPSPMATPSGSRINPMLDPRFSAASMSLPSKDANPSPNASSPPLTPGVKSKNGMYRTPTRATDPAFTPPSKSPNRSNGFKPLPPFGSFFQGQPLDQAFPPLDARHPSPPLSTTSSKDSADSKHQPRKVVGLAHVKKPPSSTGKRKTSGERQNSASGP